MIGAGECLRMERGRNIGSTTPSFSGVLPTGAYLVKRQRSGGCLKRAEMGREIKGPKPKHLAARVAGWLCRTSRGWRPGWQGWDGESGQL